MRASDLIGRRVVDRDGHRVGHVVDLVVDQDGPLLGLHAALRVHTLVVSRHVSGSQLGYTSRRQQRGPWLVAVAARWLHRRHALVPWSAIADRADEIRLRVPAADLDRDTVW